MNFIDDAENKDKEDFISFVAVAVVVLSPVLVVREDGFFFFLATANKYM